MQTVKKNYSLTGVREGKIGDAQSFKDSENTIFHTIMMDTFNYTFVQIH